MASNGRLVCLEEWSSTAGILYFHGKIYILDYSDLWRQVVALCHGTWIGRHAGRWKTLELVSHNYWWPQMSHYIGKYISTCDLCLCTKAQRHLPVRGLHPLLIPSAPWDTISVDFIVELLESSGHNAIMVVVDLVTKRAHFASTITTITATGTAQLFLQQVWRHHGLPWKVVYDRVPNLLRNSLKNSTGS